MKLFIFTLAFLIFAYGNEKSITVVIPEDWPPYYQMKDGKPTGYAVDLFEAIVKPSDLKFHYKSAENFEEVIRLFESGEGDVIPNVGISDERLDLFVFTQPTDTFDIYMYKRKTSYSIKNVKDFSNKKIGLIKTNICNELVEKFPKKQVVYFEDFRQGIKELNAGVIDGFCYPEPLMEIELRELGFSNNIEAISPPLKEIKRGMGISKRNFELLSFFNEQVTKLKLSGEYDKIHSKWFGETQMIELTESELVFIVLSLLGASFTTIIVILYIFNKKKWLITKETLNKEIQLKTEKLKKRNKELVKIQEDLKEQSYIDQLTKIRNRKAYKEKLDELVNEGKRYKKPFSFLMFDIDNFKDVNDTFGHSVGDEVLVSLANCVKKDTRANDYFYRIGGEEFVILLADTQLNGAKSVAEKIRSSVEKHIYGKDQSITVSIGLSEFLPEDTKDSIYKRVDALMYKSKEAGKNRVTFD